MTNDDRERIEKINQLLYDLIEEVEVLITATESDYVRPAAASLLTELRDVKEGWVLDDAR